MSSDETLRHTPTQMQMLIERCKRYAAVIEGIIVVPDDYQPGDEHLEFREPRTTLLEVAEVLNSHERLTARVAELEGLLSEARDFLLDANVQLALSAADEAKETQK